MEGSNINGFNHEIENGQTMQNTNETSTINESEQLNENIPVSTSNESIEIHSKTESLKMKMAQYLQNNNKDSKIHSNNHLQNMKSNKQEEKDEEITGEEIQNNDFNLDNKNNEKFAKEMELIMNLKKDNYKKLYRNKIFCDFRLSGDKEWKIGFIEENLEDNILAIKDIKSETIHKIKIDERNKIAYFRKYSKISNENFFDKRDNKKELKLKLEYIENFINENNFVNKKDVYELYYIIHSKIYLGLDSAMKTNDIDENVGTEESFRIILDILLFLSQYYKYILENKDNFLNYINNKNTIDNSELIDLKIVNKQYAFFSFFDESLDLLNKIFANEVKYLDWFIYFEKKLQRYVPFFIDDNGDIKPNINSDLFPIYKEQQELDKGQNKKNKLLLTRICLENAYNLKVTYTTSKVKIKAYILAYFIDYFHALNGFEYLFKLSYCDKSINLELLLNILNGLNLAKSITGNYSNFYLKEKQELYRFVYIFIQQLNENTIINYQKDQIIQLIQKASKVIALNNQEEPKYSESMYFDYISKNLLLSKKLDQKIYSLNILNDIINNIEYNMIKKKCQNNYCDISIQKMTFQDFCINCKKNHIIKILLNEQNVHEETIRRLPKIIFIMYKNNFGYINKTDEEKINIDKKMIFNVLFNKLLESEQSNENLTKNIYNIICSFCEILSEEDKLYVYEEIKKYLEKSIEKREMPVKDQLLFIIEFTVKAIESKNIKEEKINNKKSKNKIEESEENEEEEDDEDYYYIEDNSKSDEKLINLNLEDGDYYGLNLLKNYLLEEEYRKYSNMTNEQKIELITTSIEGIIKIIQVCTKKDLLLKYLFFKAIEAINKSCNILQFLILFDKIRNNKNMGKKFNSILINYSRDYGFLDSLMNDIMRYICLVNSLNNEKNIPNDILNNKEIEDLEEKNIYEGLFNNKLNIKLRLKLIIFLLSMIGIEKDLEATKELISKCESNTYSNICFNILIYKNLKKFSGIFIILFYDNILDNKKIFNMNDLQYYQLCKEIIKSINKIYKIFYFMNNKDIAVLKYESESKIKGINILWNFLIKTKNNEIRNDITDFFADIFLGIKLDNMEKIEIYWKNFIETIYNKLDEIIKENNSENEQAIQGIISLIKKIEIKSCNKGEIIEDNSQIIKEATNFINKYKKRYQDEKKIYAKKFLFNSNLNGINDDKDYEIKINSIEYFYILRYKLSFHYKIPVNTVRLSIDTQLFDKKIQEDLRNFELDLFDDFSETLSMFTNLEREIISKNKDKKIRLKFIVNSVENEEFKTIKRIIKNIPKLTKLLKIMKNTNYILDVWKLIKDENKNTNKNIIKNIKEILQNKEDLDKINSLFNFEETNIFYISYVLSNLNIVINELNEKNNNFINNIFLCSAIWTKKIMNIKIENKENPNLWEIYEKNNVINYLLNIYLIVSQRSFDPNILLFILSKVIEYYYLIIKENIYINLKSLSSKGMEIYLVEELYNKNIDLIQEIIIKNKIIFENFIKILLLNENTFEKNNNLKYQFSFICNEGLLKNKNFSLNKKIKAFLIDLLDIIACNKQQKEENYITNIDFYTYLINLFFTEKSFEKFINYIKEIALDKKLVEESSNLEDYDNNIKLFFEIITDIIEKIYSILNQKINLKKFISNVILRKISCPVIEGIPLDISFHETVLGGNCKILLHLLSKSNNYKELLNLEEIEEKKMKQYLFEEIIMNKCNKNIYNENNIDNYQSISIDSSYCFKQAVNLFVFLLLKQIKNDGDKEFNYYLDKLTEFHNQILWKNDNISDWKLSFDEKNKSSFVGLKNLGCTCYMNSLLQVFFNFIPFRESLLKCECKEEPKNSLYQIKKLFYSLKYLHINYYNPESFTKNFDDEILNIHQQMDVDEFYINILDKIENRLKGTKNENLVKYFFQGIQNDVLTFQDGCTHHRNNFNSFYSIQLQVQNKKNIYESLDALTEGELMNGDNCIFCAQCNKKLPVIKSQNFKSLPRILLFVLKRFEFNFDSMKKVKIDDYYEFPYELDMTKYKSQYDKKNENNNSNNLNIYVLKSIVVHMGTCENGHYYSFIRNKNGTWYEFNDSVVRPFNINLLNDETFGGEELIYNNGEKKLRKKNKSAYLLFYEKKDQSDCQQFENIEAIRAFLANNNLKEENNENNNIIIENGGIKKSKNEENKDNNDNGENGMKKILENITKEMFKYFLNKKLFSNDYQYFILELYLNILNFYYYYELPVFLMHLCRNMQRTTEIFREVQEFGSNLNLYLDNKKLILFNSEKHKYQKNSKISNYNYSSQILNLFKHFIIYFYNIFLRTKEKEFLGGMVDLIKFFINDQQNCANYLIEEFCNTNIIIEYLINCPLYNIKKLLVGILYCAMIKSIDNENKKSISSEEKDITISTKDDEEIARQLQNQEENEINYLKENPLDYKNIPKNILKMIYNILHIIRATKYNQMNEHRFLYFTIYRFSLISEKTREFLIYKSRVLELLCLILHSNYQKNDYNVKEIISSTNIGPYTVNHNIINPKRKEEVFLNIDKSGIYKNENYVYMLFFYLLSYTPQDKNAKKVYDQGYSLENKEFINALLNNIRTKQDAFCFSNYINEKSKDSKKKIYNVYEVLGEILNKIDNNDKINYEYNNYNNYVDSNMNENPNPDDPGINPKYFIIIFKKFILNLLYNEDYIQKGLRLIFESFKMNQNFYSYSIMLIDLVIELFSSDLKEYSIFYKKELEFMTRWLETWPIPPSKYEISGINMYKNYKIKYDNKLSEDLKNEFDRIELNNTQNKIDMMYDILNNNIAKNSDFKNEKDIDLSNFKFIIGDTILYQNKKRVIEEALDEQLKISVELNMKNINKNKEQNDKKEIWIEIDNPTIELEKLKGK